MYSVREFAFNNYEDIIPNLERVRDNVKKELITRGIDPTQE